MIKRLAEPRKEKKRKDFWNFSTSSGWSRVPRWAWPREEREREWSTPSNTRGDSTVSQEGAGSWGGVGRCSWTNHTAAAVQSQSSRCLCLVQSQSRVPPPPPAKETSHKSLQSVPSSPGRGWGGGVSRSVRHTWWKKSGGGVFSTPRQRSTILTASDTTHTEEVRVTRNSRSNRLRLSVWKTFCSGGK